MGLRPGLALTLTLTRGAHHPKPRFLPKHSRHLVRVRARARVKVRVRVRARVRVRDSVSVRVKGHSRHQLGHPIEALRARSLHLRRGRYLGNPPGTQPPPS